MSPMARRRELGLLVAALLTAAAAAGCGSAAPSPETKAATTGRGVFQSAGCSSCHVLADAGAKGQVGPDLDDVQPSLAAARKQITDGGGGMPAFKDTLTEHQLDLVARYVASVAGR
jgi:cytochrome c6